MPLRTRLTRTDVQVCCSMLVQVEHAFATILQYFTGLTSHMLCTFRLYFQCFPAHVRRCDMSVLAEYLSGLVYAHGADGHTGKCSLRSWPCIVGP